MCSDDWFCVFDFDLKLDTSGKFLDLIFFDIKK